MFKSTVELMFSKCCPDVNESVMGVGHCEFNGYHFCSSDMLGCGDVNLLCYPLLGMGRVKDD